jgi:hypothetical protein
VDVIITEILFFSFGCLCIAAAVLAMYHVSTYLNRRWGQVPAVVVTGLAFFPLVMGGWVLLYLVLVAGWISKKIRRRFARNGGGGVLPAG